MQLAEACFEMVTGSGCPSKLAASSSVNNVGQADALRIGDIGENEYGRVQQRRRCMGLCVGVGKRFKDPRRAAWQRDGKEM